MRPLQQADLKTALFDNNYTRNVFSIRGLTKSLPLAERSERKLGFLGVTGICHFVFRHDVNKGSRFKSCLFFYRIYNPEKRGFKNSFPKVYNEKGFILELAGVWGEGSVSAKTLKNYIQVFTSSHS